jgi:hypothetical protein
VTVSGQEYVFGPHSGHAFNALARIAEMGGLESQKARFVNMRKGTVLPPVGAPGNIDDFQNVPFVDLVQALQKA